MTQRVRFTPWIARGVFAVGLAAAAAPAPAGEIPFTAHPPLVGGLGRVRSASPADIDRDGDLDVVANSTDSLLSNQLVWLENVDGDGSAWTTHTIATWGAGDHYRVLTADVDGDGDADVVASMHSERFEVGLLWWENVGAGVWTRHVIAGGVDAAIAVGDIDGDGDLDVAENSSGSGGSAIVWFQNAGHGTDWTGHLIADQQGQFRAMPMADLDGDGDLDAIGHDIGGSTSWFENDGHGEGWTRHALLPAIGGATPQSMIVADIDRDGDPDLFTSFPTFNGSVEWVENMGGARSWVRHQVGTANFPWAVTVADLDGDGDLDGLAAEQSSDQLIWYENLAAEANVWSAHNVGTLVDEALSLETPDLDGDGDLDVLAPAFHGGDVRWLENVSLHGSACFDPGLPIARLPASSVSSADFDGDGDLDALSAPPVVWHENVGGSGVSWVEHAILGAVGESARPVDFDHDGDVDVIHASRADDRVSWLENTAPDGSAWSEHSISTALDGPAFAVGADLLQDGHTDVVSASFLDDTVTWHREVFSGFWATQAISTTSDGARCVATADMDRDGDLDVVAASSGDSTLAWYENTFPGPVPWPRRTVTTAAAGAAFVAVADVDREGDPDLLGASVLDDRVSWYENTAGNGTVWQERTITTAADGATSVASADLDRDGDLDVLSSSAGDGTVAWYENVGGAGAAWTRRTITAQAPGAASVTAADLDRDGLPDVMAGSSAGVVWYPNRGGQFALAAMDQAPGTALNGSLVAMLRVDATHLGRPGDGDLELARLGLRLESANGPLTPAQANAVIESLRIYRDANGNGVFDEMADALVYSQGQLLPAEGALTLPFADGDPNGQVTTGATRTYFVVAELTTDASAHDPRQFRIVHLGLGSHASAAEDRDHDIPLRPACPADVSSGLVTTVVPVELTTFAVE